MGCEHILNINALPGAAVRAVFDPVPASLGWARTALGETAPTVAFCSSLDELMRSGIDAVVIATPNHRHVEDLRVLLDSPLHLMVEKPLCTTIQDCIEVVDRAERRDALTWMALEYRFMPTVEVALEQTRQGALGNIHMVSIREHRFPFLPKVNNWNRLSRHTGGTLVEKCCHFFDLMRQLAGSNPTRVFASGGQAVNHLDEWVGQERSDVLDHALVIVEFDNGVRGSLDLCMFAEGGRFEQELTVVGDRAKIETTVPGAQVWIGERHEPGQREISAPIPEEVTHVGFHHGSSQREHLRFIEAIRGGTPALVTVEDGLWATAMGQRSHESIERGEPISIGL
jgi:myo-inositol 2-dehydrogenase/D-chiro-inositol 1-dehydrogenase